MIDKEVVNARTATEYSEQVHGAPGGKIKVFSTCPPSDQFGGMAPSFDRSSSNSTQSEGEAYLNHVVEIARWTEEGGCEGILVYTNNLLVDPWQVAQVIIQNTRSICPLVAIQPTYMHPYWLAKIVATLAHLFGRRVYLNMVAGGFRNDLIALNDTTPHDRRYDRIIEYTTIINRLLTSSSPVTFKGGFYSVEKLKLIPPVTQEMLPGILISGSSDAGLAAAKAIGATAIWYPKPSGEYEGEVMDKDLPAGAGIRIGIIAREDEDEAWAVAHQRFPEDRRGQIAHQLAMKTSDAVWHKQLSEMAKEADEERNSYWLVPFENYKTACPYLVGSYEVIASELARYFAAGYRTLILDIPPTFEEIRHTNVVLNRALNNPVPN